MKKKILFIIMICIVLSLVSCGKKNDYNKDTDSQGIVLVAEEQKIESGIDNVWMRSQHIQDRLYYLTLNKSSDLGENIIEINVINDKNESKLVYTFNGMVITDSFAVDTQENIYVIVKENNKEYHLDIISNVGEVKKQVMLSDEAARCINKEGCQDAITNEYGYCILTTKGTCIIWDNKGNEVSILKQDLLFKYTEMSIGLVNGKNSTYIYQENGVQICLFPINMEHGAIEDEISVNIPITSTGLALFKIYSGYQSGIFISSYDNLYQYDDEINTLKEMLAWYDPFINLDRSNIFAIGMDANSYPYFYCYDETTRQATRVQIAERRKDELDIEIIEIGYFRDTTKSALSKYVGDFNKEQENVVAVFKKYNDLTDMQLNIVSGKGPDIISVYGLDIDEYVEKNVLENLDPYLESSDRIDKDDILISIQEIMTRDGAIRFVFPEYTINVMLIKNECLEDDTITVTDYLHLTEVIDSEYLCDLTEASLFLQLFNYEKDKYIDWEKRECYFDSEQFISFLEDLKQSKLVEQRSFGFVKPEQLYYNEFISSFLVIGNVKGYAQIEYAFGDIAKIESYPNWEKEEQYPINMLEGCLAINSLSNKKEDAWTFLEYYLCAVKENSNALRGNFSVFESKFEEQLFPALKENSSLTIVNMYTDEPMKYTYEDNENLLGLTDEDREKLRFMVDNLVWSDPVPSGIVTNIVFEECKYYLSGAKSAEEVARIIQNRVSLYMEE